MKLNGRGYEHARELIEQGRVELDDRDEWSEHQPSPAEENRFLEQHGFSDYGKWFLGVVEDKSPDTKGHF
jgi:hypothetical protein